MSTRTRSSRYTRRSLTTDSMPGPPPSTSTCLSVTAPRPRSRPSSGSSKPGASSPSNPTSARRARSRRAVVIGIALGVLGTMLVTPGQSLAVPTAIVGAVGGGIVLASWVVASFRARRQAGWILAVGAAVVTVLACLWTFEFALPTAIEWSNATEHAQDTFNKLHHSSQNSHGTLPPQPCILHDSGAVGPLSAPYKECAIWSPEGHALTFVSSSPSNSGGLVHTDRPSAFFADECERHLTGNWWMFAPSTVSNGDPGSCYYGYQFHGGGRKAPGSHNAGMMGAVRTGPRSRRAPRRRQAIRTSPVIAVRCRHDLAESILGRRLSFDLVRTR